LSRPVRDQTERGNATRTEGVIPGILSERSLPITATFRVRLS